MVSALWCPLHRGTGRSAHLALFVSQALVRRQGHGHLGGGILYGCLLPKAGAWGVDDLASLSVLSDLNLVPILEGNYQ